MEGGLGKKFLRRLLKGTIIKKQTNKQIKLEKH